ncbi:TPA: hypothetical protein HA231_03940 [Candidatus Woesearchaeota archaeon]|nr:hypothetical protein [Candidatus Woesearchaeota archaeon]
MGNDLVERLEKIAPRYTYRGLDWVTRIGSPITFPGQRAIVLDGFYSEKGHDRTGICNELMLQAYLDITNDKRFGRLYDEGRLYRVKGGDPVYFSMPPARMTNNETKVVTNVPRQNAGAHLFLAVTDKRVVPHGQSLSGKDATQALLDGNAVVFDPSFRVVEPMKKSEYLVEEIWAPGCRVTHSKKAAVFENSTRTSAKQVVGISGGLILIMVAYYPSEDSNDPEFWVDFMAPLKQRGAPNNIINLYDNNLDYAAKSVEGLDKFLSHMRNACRESIPGNDMARYKLHIEVS